MNQKRRGKLKESAATLERALKIAELQVGVLPDSSTRRSRGVIELDRSDIAYQQGKFEDCKRSANRSHELLDQNKTAPSGERQTTDPLFAAVAVRREASALRELGQTSEALVVLDDAVARIEALPGAKKGRDERFHECLARIERARTAEAVPDRRVAAAADLVEVIKASEKLVDDFPDVNFYREGLASAYLRRGELLTLTGQPALAEEELTKSLKVSRALLDRHGVLSASLLVRGQTFLALGRAQAELGKYDDAGKNWNNAAKVFEIALKIDPDNFHHRHGLAGAQEELKLHAK